MKKIILLIISFNLFQYLSIGQHNQTLDSLKNVLQKSKQDTSKVNTLIAFVNEYVSIDEGDSAISYANKVLELSNKIDFKLGIARGYRGIGLGYKIKKDNIKAIEYFSKGLAQDEKIGDKTRMKDDFRNLTVCFSAMKNFTQSLEYARLLLKLCEETKDTLGIALCYENNIAGNYALQNDNIKTLEYLAKALKLFELLKDKKNSINVTIKIGNIYGRKMSNFPKALDYFITALRLAERVGDKESKLYSYFYIADMYKAIHDYPKALEYKFKALKMFESEKDKTNNVKNGIAACYLYIGTIYLETDDNHRAMEYFNKAIILFSTIKSKEGLGSSYLMLGQIYTKLNDYAKGKENYLKGNEIFAELVKENPLYYLSFSASYGGLGKIYYLEQDYLTAIKYHNLAIKINKEHNCNAINLIEYYRDISNAYEEIKDYKSALENYKLSKNLHDSIYSDENNKKLGDLKSKFEIEKKEIELTAKAKAEEYKIRAIANAESKKQKLIILFIGLGLMFVMVFASFIFRTLHIRNKQNKIIVEQKAIVEEKNREILDSIEYALRIQTAILPPRKIVNQYLENSFILYKPKDIVAGDFYWMETMNDSVLFAACDCTGHGVPGAMVSVVCYNALNRAVREFGLTQPAAILDKTAEIVLENFSKSEEEIQDGMDISICSLNTKTNLLEWAGANNSLLLINNGQLSETKADKQCIGHNDNVKPFTNHEFNLQPDTSIYLFTDGFADQFGGQQNRKLTKSKFKELLLSIQHLPIQQQAQELDTFITNYKHATDQTDDILVIGVRV